MKILGVIGRAGRIRDILTSYDILTTTETFLHELWKEYKIPKHKQMRDKIRASLDDEFQKMEKLMNPEHKEPAQ